LRTLLSVTLYVVPNNPPLSAGASETVCAVLFTVTVALPPLTVALTPPVRSVFAGKVNVTALRVSSEPMLRLAEYVVD
jgi:hypothetical protein